MSKETDVEYIKKFSSISVTDICNNLKVARGNMYTMKAKSEKIKQVKDEIKKQLKELEKFDKQNEKENKKENEDNEE